MQVRLRFATFAFFILGITLLNYVRYTRCWSYVSHPAQHLLAQSEKNVMKVSSTVCCI